MTNEQMLKHLYDIQDNGVNDAKLNKWIVQLKDDIALENCASVTERNMLAECKKLLKVQAKQRPVLSKVDMQEIDGITYQVMTDSFRLVCLKHMLYLPRVNEDEHFPDVKRIVPNRDPYDVLTMTYKEAVARNKSIKKREGIKLDEIMVKGEPMRFNSDLFVSLFKCLGTNEAKIKVYKNDYGFMPMRIEPCDNDNGFAVLVPVKVYD